MCWVGPVERVLKPKGLKGPTFQISVKLLLYDSLLIWSGRRVSSEKQCFVAMYFPAPPFFLLT